MAPRFFAARKEPEGDHAFSELQGADPTYEDQIARTRAIDAGTTVGLGSGGGTRFDG